MGPTKNRPLFGKGHLMTEETLRFRNIVPNNRIFHKCRVNDSGELCIRKQIATMRTFFFKSLLLSSLLFAGLSANAQGPFPMFNNRTHSVEAQPFADLSQRIWDLMADKNADALKEIFHSNAMFVHMGGYWDCAQELATIGGGFIHYKHAEVYGVDVKQINADNWAVYSTIKLDAALGGGDNIVSTPFFVTQTFTREDGKWWLTAMVFTTRTSGPGIEPGQNMNH